MANSKKTSFNKTCEQCKGSCWNSDQSKRQAKVRATFGTPLPNKCVDGELDGPKCPYRP